MEKVNFTGPMDYSTKVNSKTTNVTGWAHFTIHVAKSLKDSGNVEKRMGDAFTLGLTVQNITSYISMERSREKES